MILLRKTNFKHFMINFIGTAIIGKIIVYISISYLYNLVHLKTLNYRPILIIIIMLKVNILFYLFDSSLLFSMYIQYRIMCYKRVPMKAGNKIFFLSLIIS